MSILGILSTVKGNNIDFQTRERILKYIGSKPEIKYFSILFDLNSGSDQAIQAHKDKQLQKFQEAADGIKNPIHPNMAKEILLMRNQVKNLSLSNYVKYIFATGLFSDWQQYFQFDYVYLDPKRDSWELNHIIDNQSEPGKFIRLVRDTMVLTNNELNPNFKVYSPKEWPKNHPFNKKNGTGRSKAKIDGRLFFKNFRLGDEKIDFCLFLPDLIGNTIYNSIMKSSEIRWLKILKRIKQNRSLSITLKDKIGYYIINGFDPTKTKHDINPMIKAHHKLMAQL